MANIQMSPCRMAVHFRRINGDLDRRNAAEVGNEPQVTKEAKA